MKTKSNAGPRRMCAASYKKSSNAPFEMWINAMNDLLIGTAT